MTRSQWLILAVLASAVLLLYCIGGIFVVQTLMQSSEQTAGVTHALEPTSTLTPHTATPTRLPVTFTPTLSPTAPRTATWVLQPPPPAAPASGTPRPPTLATTPIPGAAAPLVAAWNKSQTVTTYRVALDMSASGKLGLPGAVANQTFPLMSVSGDVNGKDSHLVIKGFVTMILSGDANKPIEILTIGNKTYIHGPVPMLGANEDKWYVSTTSSPSSLSQSSDFADFLGTNPDLNGFKKAGNETLDGRKCDVYTGDKTATYNLFAGLDTQGTLDKQTLEALETAESKFWICDDGYFHQLWMKMEAHDKNQPSEKITLELKLHIYDYHANIKLTPPATAAPLQIPSFGIPTPAPTKPK